MEFKKLNNKHILIKKDDVFVRLSNINNFKSEYNPYSKNAWVVIYLSSHLNQVFELIIENLNTLDDSEVWLTVLDKDRFGAIWNIWTAENPKLDSSDLFFRVK